MGDRLTLAEKLLNSYPSKAVELLMDYLQDKAIRTETEQYIGQHDPSPAKLDAAFEQQTRSTRNRSHYSDASPPQRTTRQNIPNARYGQPTPSNSAGSVKSHTSSMAAAGLERIYLLSCDADGAEKPVYAKIAQGKHNLIGDKVAFGRGLGTDTDPVDEVVAVPLPPGSWEKATRAVSLTWRRRNEFTTNEDTFYIVSARSLDCDVILASDETLEYQVPSDMQEAHSPQARYQPGGLVRIQELGPAIPPPAPSAPIHSHQQASLPIIQQTYDKVQALRDMQRMHTGDPSAPAYYGQPNHTNTPLAAHESSSGQLQVMGLWDKTPIQMSFDPKDSGEAFYQAFHQWAVRRKRGGDLERHRMTLWLKASKKTPDNEALEISLKEAKLEQLWEMAVDWIQENKSPKAPHLFATVELEAG